MHKKLWILFTILLLIGCTEQNEPIRYPENISLDGELLVFDAVPHATSYTVKIENEVYQTDISSFLLSLIPNGTYDVRFQTHTNAGSSYFSPPFSITLNRAYQVPQQITLHDDILSWDAVDGALGYSLCDGTGAFATTNELSYDLSSFSFEPNELYYFGVGAIYQTTDVAYGNRIYHHTYVDLNLDLETSYEQDFTTDLTYDFGEPITIEYIMLDEQIILDDLYQLDDSILTIHIHELQVEQLDILHLEILTPDGFMSLDVNIIDAKPKLISPSTVYYEPLEDLTFEFNLNDGSFVQLSGNDITLEDYQFEDSTLTIFSSYVQDILTLNPTRERIILLYQLEKESDIIMGFIFIELINPSE